MLLNAAAVAAPHASDSEKNKVPLAIEKQAKRSDEREVLLDQVDALRRDNQDLSLRVAALEEGETPQAEGGEDRFSRMSIAVLGAATFLLALRVRKLK